MHNLRAEYNDFNYVCTVFNPFDVWIVSELKLIAQKCLKKLFEIKA